MVGGSPQLSIQGTKAPTIDPLFLHVLCCFLGLSPLSNQGTMQHTLFQVDLSPHVNSYSKQGPPVACWETHGHYSETIFVFEVTFPPKRD